MGIDFFSQVWQGISFCSRADLWFVTWTGNSNRNNSLAVNSFATVGLTVGWHLPAAKKHLTVKVRAGKTSWISH